MRLTAYLFALAFAIGPAAAAPRPASPAAFLRDAVAGDNGEIALGELAVRNAGSEPVRAFGRLLVEDHGAARRDALAAAARRGIAIAPHEMKPEARLLAMQLAHVSGSEFDTTFVSHMIEDHRADIASFEAQAASGDADTAGLARATLPHLRHHLAVAEALQGTEAAACAPSCPI